MIGTGLAARIWPAPNFEDRWHGKVPDILLLHYTGMDDAEQACAWLCSEESRVSCHYLVDEQGQITQMVGEDKRAWHAGVSSWHGDTDINSRSIGIEIQNRGHAGGYPDFPPAQMAAVAALSRDICSRWDIAPRRVLAHSDVAPGRKIDPGEKFDWGYLHAHGIGHWVKPEPLQAGDCLVAGDEDAAVMAFQEELKSYGYGLDASGCFDQRTKDVTAAFQRHFRPERVDGLADPSTRKTLASLLRF